MVKPRIPEGGAILNEDNLTMEEYSEYMKKKMGFEYRSIVKYVIKNLDPPHGAKVLEIGPGPGWIGIWLVKERPDLTLQGIEPSPDMIRVANKNAQAEGVADQVEYTMGYVEEMSMISNSAYNLILSNDSLHHWKDPLKGFLEISRILKPEGLLYIKDERRDLGIRAKFIVYVIGRLLAGKQWKYWKSSIAASYTPTEIQEFLTQGNLKNWIVNSTFMDLSIEKLKI
jgi:ubiquinone/menaquinone biosynthesis C-methylase UbiE